MAKIYKSNPLILNETRDYLDGLMISDGHIHCANSMTGYYHQLCKEKKWLDKINEDLYEYGVESKVNNGRLCIGDWQPDGGSLSYSIQTCSYIEFNEVHDRWYKPWYDIDNYSKYFWHKDEDGEYFIWQKVVPKDICLSPECVANWYLGDGSTTKKTYRDGYQTQLATNGFLREDVEFLLELLSEVLDIKCGVNKRKVIQISSQANIITFLNYIKDYEVDCYAYKFPDKLMNNIKENIL